ncbi:hypothetical protein [uncultured Rhizobium sp.]|jgi:hypothetical protein|uniref:hypothetical protein n=1 Tax=Neorhizobium sp. DAR64872/K0K18 TaxID=3421958 RepID=UPI002D7E8767|nr:hypothetical protein [uncultured Rhizobium sp.]
MVSLSTLSVLVVIGAVVLFTVAGIGFHRKVQEQERQRAEYRRRAEVKLRANALKLKWRSILRPLGMKGIALEPYRTMKSVDHRRRINLHADLDSGPMQ